MFSLSSRLSPNKNKCLITMLKYKYHLKCSKKVVNHWYLLYCQFKNKPTVLWTFGKSQFVFELKRRIPHNESSANSFLSHAICQEEDGCSQILDWHLNTGWTRDEYRGNHTDVTFKHLNLYFLHEFLFFCLWLYNIRWI